MAKTEPEFGNALEERSPGAHLRRAREAANMNVDKVAAALLLQPQMIEALEADSFDHLPAPTFVRGYLRGYARLLGLPAEPILDMYDRRGFEPPPLAPDVVETKQAHTSDTVVRIVTYSVAAALVLLVGLWWHSQEGLGFGIGGDLFDWPPDASPNPSSPAVEAPATATFDEEAGGGSIGVAPGRTDELPPDGDFLATFPAEGTAPGGTATDESPPATGEAGGGSIVATPLPPGAFSQDEEAPVAAPTEDPVPGGAALAANAPSRDEEAPVAAPAEDLASGGAALAANAPSRDEEAPVAAPAEDPAPGAAALAANAPSRDEEVSVAAPAEDPAPEGVAVVESAPAVAGASATTTDRETPSTPEPRSEVAVGAVADGGTDPAADTGHATGAGSGDADGGDASAPDVTGRADGADAVAGAAASTETPPAVTATPSSGTDRTGTGVGPAAALDTVRSGLVLEFVHESWVEVYDRDRTRLFLGLVQPGRVLSFDGVQPFDVLLGAGKDVRVEIDGEAFDHEPYMRHGVARFSVGSAPDAAADGADPSPTQDRGR